MEETEFITNSAQDTQKLGAKIAEKLSKREIVSLSGDLGAGKTTFTQGLAQGLGIKSRVISPTFMLVRKHPGTTINLYHIDLYRVEKQTEIKELGLDEIFEDENGIFVIEWAKRHQDLKADWEIIFEQLKDDKRKITINKK